MSGHGAESECVCTCGFKGLYPAVLRFHLADPAAWPASGGMWRGPDGSWRQREAPRLADALALAQWETDGGA